ncbi:MAG TPA: phosphate-starvation-inducible PsiE family protein [Candidatus Saccharimonadales bacterium]|jgi:uncharacterized membrane protein (DUF373 family)
MKLNPKNNTFFVRLSEFFSTFLKYALNMLLLLLCIALVAGIVKAGYNLFTSFEKPLPEILQAVLVDTVFIVAILEIAITILGYLKDGQVHVRYIVDTILIIMVNEIVVLWFQKPELEKMIGISVIVLTLALIRISVTRFAPKEEH